MTFDHLIRIVTTDGSLRAAAARTTDLVEDIRNRQGTDPTATVAVGRLATGAALLGSLLKGEQRLALTLEGNGPLGKLFAETDGDGRVRASLKNPVAGLPPRDDRFDVVGAVGKAGFLHVTKDLGLREPYHSTVQLVSSEIAEDLAWYLTSSEQVPSTVALGVSLGGRAEVAAAGGFLVQALPGGDPALIPRLEGRLQDFPPVTVQLREGKSPAEILARLFEGIPFSVRQKTPLVFHCGCNRAQVARVLGSLGEMELREMMAGEEEVTVTCEFCRERYSFDRKTLSSLLT